ncbi:hypothetical protein ABFX02_04G173000 [Erythranthe guttata]
MVLYRVKNLGKKAVSFGDSRFSTDEYLEKITRMHRIFNNNSPHVEKNDDRKGKISRVNHENNRAPEVVQKKVHFVEHEKTENSKDKTIDAEADGFITQKHKKFELCKWDTFKPVN